MKFKRYLSGIALTSIALSFASAASDNVVNVDRSLFKSTGPAPLTASAKQPYIIQLKGAPAISVASEIGELQPSNQVVARLGNDYNPNTPAMSAYVAAVKQKQAEVAAQVGISDVLHNYAHTFNGFSAILSESEASALAAHPEVSAVYLDEVHQLQTSNTPAFLGLTGPDGQHTLGIKGEDVIVGILDSGVWPENPSFGEDPSVASMSYGPAPERWTGECNVGSVGSFTNDDGDVLYTDATAPVDEFECNNKLIGARYFGSTFSSVYEMRFDLGEFASPRDADGHGSHTASTAAGNSDVTAVLQGANVGTVSGIAPRARVAAYKVCWNANYVSPEGVNERGCFFGDSMAAIDQAVVDGVDVLNYSIGNSNAINTPVYNAALRAAEAGVFFAGSGGNSGPGPATVSNIAPWVATVAASTYDGESAVIGTELTVDAGDLAGQALFSVPAVIGSPIPESGLSGELVTADPVLACDPLTNTDLTGKIALIARGSCNFSTKLLNAQAVGAIGAVVYTDSRTPIGMGGDGTGVNIVGVMVTNADGQALEASVANGLTSVTMTNTATSGTATEVGNIMAGFSSRGVNTQSADIIKPDITAPGVRILAASSPEQLLFGGNPQGEDFAYLQGTSMSSPHIAGMAALLSGQYPDWSQARIKSAIMTTARQNVVKEDGATPADPFDFGAGHVDPVPAMNPGLVYDANIADYLAFLCGQGEEALVSNYGQDTSCGDLETRGFAFDASELNYPSIAIGTLEDTETVSRTVTDVTGNGGVYTVNVEAPAGLSVEVATFDEAGVETESELLEVAPNGTASYSLTFSKEEGFTPDVFTFGSVTLEGDNGIDVRSPIAVNPAADITIEVPESLTLQLNRGRARARVLSLYDGQFNVDYEGLTPAAGISGSAISLPGAFNFNANLASSTFLRIPSASLIRFTLTDALVGEGGTGTDLDLIVYRCVDFSCNLVESSATPGSNEEDIMLVNPVPNDPADPGALYILFVQGVDTAGAEAVDYTVATWIVDGAESTTRVSASSKAVSGRFNTVNITTRGLDENGLYMGTMTFTDGNGEVQGTTALEVLP